MAEQSRYLDYLDKEMTIMGILSTFCVAVIALVLDRVCGADKPTLFLTVRETQGHYLWPGTVAFSLAAALFYKQRSDLAWFYGQIALSLTSPSVSGQSTDDLYRDADSWATWIPYRCAFTALAIGAVLLALAVLAACREEPIPPPVVLALAIGVTAIQAVWIVILWRCKYEDDPIRTVFPFLRQLTESASRAIDRALKPGRKT